MFEKLKAAQVLAYTWALAQRGYTGLQTEVQWKQTSRQYPHGNEREEMRRARQIACGILRTDNGLVHRGQLVSKPNGSLKLRWQ